MEEQGELITKLELEKEIKSPLMVFIFLTHPPEIQLTTAKGILVLAYDLETAMNRAGYEMRKVQEIKNWKMFYTGQKINVSEFIAKLELDKTVFPLSQQEEKTGTSVQNNRLNISQFKAGLLLAAEELVKVEKDKETLKDIIKRLNAKN